ncbi:hypothetical protein A2Y85_06250 [candidate division WOR-3 bacterium RBG_13_43_14]|uniref:Methyltransferase type 11 domain-containing protein n=1 Tax=candidate division WOR-3 bacterium RBG_13_43_14 TaxID=1802590 RepID=A0A1F4U356_UNCW3|nr:MAG: hypothetical protein A2Y85_06250 [candidate division WOR-3 bacterium RBG_13_43_14]
MIGRASTKKTWDRFWSNRSSSEIYPPVNDIASELKKVTDLAYKKILEVGAGTGRDSIRISAEQNQVYVLDYSPISIDLIRSQPHSQRLLLIQSDALSCPVPDGTFDIIFHQGLLEHFSSPHRLLKENHRILKSGGFLAVDVPQTIHIYTLIKQALILCKLWFGGWERQFTPRSLSRLLIKSGFEPVHYYGDWSRPGILYKIVKLIASRLKIKLPMYPRFLGKITESFYRTQQKLRTKRILQYTAFSIGIIARKI